MILNFSFKQKAEKESLDEEALEKWKFYVI